MIDARKLFQFVNISPCTGQVLQFYRLIAAYNYAAKNSMGTLGAKATAKKAISPSQSPKASLWDTCIDSTRLLWRCLNAG